MLNKIVGAFALLILVSVFVYASTHQISLSSFVPASTINGLQYPCYHCCIPMTPGCVPR